MRPGFDWLIGQLDAHGGVLDAPTVSRLLSQARLEAGDIAPYVEKRAETYARRCVVRREHYELLVLTWAPSQGSVAHDHSGSVCSLRVMQGCASEQCFASGPDGQVRQTTATQLGAGQITVDPAVVVHALGNDAGASEVLVTVHIYSPPLPEVRRYAVAQTPPARVFLRQPPADAKVVAIIGGGFTGSMTLGNLLRFGNEGSSAIHIVLIDRQAAVGEGVAYRTNDSRHLLNVPADRMSAWPDLPDDFLNFARLKNPLANSGDFLPRKIYGEYLRKTVLDLAESAGNHLSAEIVRDEATRLAPSDSSGWTIETSSGLTVQADVAVVAVGHRPPDDPFGRRWVGPRHRFVADPWAALVLSQIGPDEPVLVLGSGLTAVDALLTLSRHDRTAPTLVISRRGLMPLSHARQALPAPDLSQLVAGWLDPTKRLTVPALLSALRRTVSAAQQTGVDWRQVIDSLRPAIPRLWGRLDVAERLRFLNHVRPFWEIHRHRMAPDVADRIEQLRQSKKVQIAAGALVSAAGDADGIDVTFTRRGTSATQTQRVSWVINCTGPGVQSRHSTHPLLRPLLENETLLDDELSLGLMTDSIGRAINGKGQVISTLLVAGTLRKSTLWESTAVPELRQRAQAVAKAALATVLRGK